MSLRLLLLGGVALLGGPLRRDNLSPPALLPPPLYATRASSAREFALAAKLPQPALLKPKTTAVVVGKNAITIRLPGKPPRVLKEDPATVEEVGQRIYDYLGQLRHLPYYAFHVNVYEGQEYLLVHRQTGAMTRLFGAPLESPQAHYVACHTTDYGLDGASYGVQVFAADSTGLRKLAELDQLDWVPEGIVWTADERLLVKAYDVPDDVTSSHRQFRYFALLPRRP